MIWLTIHVDGERCSDWCGEVSVSSLAHECGVKMFSLQLRHSQRVGDQTKSRHLPAGVDHLPSKSPHHSGGWVTWGEQG